MMLLSDQNTYAEISLCLALSGMSVSAVGSTLWQTAIGVGSDRDIVLPRKPPSRAVLRARSWEVVEVYRCLTNNCEIRT